MYAHTHRNSPKAEPANVQTHPNQRKTVACTQLGHGLMTKMMDHHTLFPTPLQSRLPLFPQTHFPLPPAEHPTQCNSHLKQ